MERKTAPMIIDMAENKIDDIEMELPQPITPVESFSGDVPPEISGMPSAQSGETVEFIKLNNAVMSVPEDELESSHAVTEELPDVSISVIGGAVANQSSNVKMELMQCDENVDAAEVTNTPMETVTSNVNGSTESSNTFEPVLGKSNPVDTAHEAMAVPVSLEKSNAIPMAPASAPHNETSILPDRMEEIVENDDTIVDNVSRDSEVAENAVESSNGETGHQDTSEQAPSSSMDTLLSDSTVFTPVDQNNVRDIVVNPNSQIFALKVKGTEDPAQLSKLVDLCKKNPLFKNKNVKFKIVPVRGAIPNALKDPTKLGGNVLSKAIIVKRSESEKAAEAQKATPPPKKTETVSNIENVTGPWECGRCENSGKPLRFHSYFEFRTHLQNVHKEANNPIFCIYCGYKALKRNMQLYHLFSKHNIPPPANIKFPKCDQCDFHALNEFYLQKHAAVHLSGAQEFVCSCKMAFKTSELLQKHMVSNDCKNKNFTCGYCRTIFDRFVNLKAHMRVCMKERSKPSLQNNAENNAARAV